MEEDAVSIKEKKMNLTLGPLAKEQEDIFIKRGTGGYQGTKVAVETDGTAKPFPGLIDASGPSSSFMRYFQENDNEYSVLFLPSIDSFLLSGDTTPTTLKKGDRLVRKTMMERSDRKDQETEIAHLIRDITDTTTGCYTISFIEERFGAQSIMVKDETELVS